MLGGVRVVLADEFVGRARVRVKGRTMREKKVESVLMYIVDVFSFLFFTFGRWYFCLRKRVR